ncbi:MULTISPECIES: hypothetical protein [unclassified Acinetobacter]|uniref:DUF7832 domain-containing protein n=1 Tax=unclassified Acinetobacter TaxID=196816 RepID=UPI00124D9E97|nr:MULTISPECIES: hypothetical protein [unclassified Acinetobacter]
MKYDDASWHYGGDFPVDLPQEAGATHIGMFLTWMLLHNFASEELIEYSQDAIEHLKTKKITGAHFLINELDEKLTDNDFSEEGNAFALAYYEGLNNDSRYNDDYLLSFSVDTNNVYRVADTWENYDKLASHIDARYCRWVMDGRPQYIA